MPWRKRKLDLGTKSVLGIPQSGKDEWASEQITEWLKEWNNEIKWVKLSVEPGPWDDADKWAGGWGWVRQRLWMQETHPICSPGFRWAGPWGQVFVFLYLHGAHSPLGRSMMKRAPTANYTPRYRSKGTECSTQVFVCEYSYQCSSQQPKGENNSNAHQLPNG